MTSFKFSKCYDEDDVAHLLASMKSIIFKMDMPPMCIALTDERGELSLFYRMHESPLRCISIAISKAYSAVRLGGPTSTFKQRLVDENVSLSDFCDSKLISLPGGDVVRDGRGQIVFGIGLSGGTFIQDLELCLQLKQLITKGLALVSTEEDSAA